MLQKMLLSFCGLMLLASAGCAGLQQADHPSGFVIVDAYVAAYNDRDVDAMAALMDDEIQWLSIDGDKIEIVADGRVDLVGQMTDYIQSPSVTTSRLEGSVIDGQFLAVQEIAKWQDEAGLAKEQSALAIYEVENNLVRRVWYYPSSN